MNPPRGRWIAALVLLVAIPAAGCIGAHDAAQDAPSGAGFAVQPGIEDPREFTVAVRAETGDGPPVAGATVVFFHNLPDPDYGPIWGPAYITEEEWPTGETLDIAGSEHFEVLAVGTTDAQGRIVARLDPDVELPAVAVGNAEGFTTEAVFDSWVLGGHRVTETFNLTDPDEPFVVPLYRTEKPIAIDGAMPTSVNDTALPWGRWPVWDPTELDFGFGPPTKGSATRAYLFRLTGLDLALTWDNTATTYADLYLLASSGGRTFVRGNDQVQLPADGSSVEVLDGPIAGGIPVRVGPATDTVAAGPDGVPYRIRGTATFEGADVLLPPSPA